MRAAPMPEQASPAPAERLRLATLLYAVAHELWAREPSARQEGLRLRALARVAPMLAGAVA